MIIDTILAQSLIEGQFPEWNNLSIHPVEKSGWDNRTFHLGDELSIRIPSEKKYAPQIIKEFKWLPILAQDITYQITLPIALGEPSKDYHWHWSINKWIEGDTASVDSISNMKHFAEELGRFLHELESIDTTGGPIAGEHNFHRGGRLSIYNGEMVKYLSRIKDASLRDVIQSIWNEALLSTWEYKPVWVHGDMACGNILVKNGALNGVIDFGQLAIGDPACDLVIAWNFFDEESREIFRRRVELDKDTWVRAMGWALWKTICWPVEGTNVLRVIENVCADYRTNFLV